MISNQNFVAVGDSLTFGENSTDPGGTTSYPYVLSQTKDLVYDVTARNLGVSGLWSGNLPDVDYALDHTKINTLALMIGINDVAFLSDTAATIFARIDAYVQARIASGWDVLICTHTGDGNFTDAQNVKMAQLDNLLRDAYREDCVDVAIDPNIGFKAPQPSAWFHADAVHLIDLGYSLLASLVASHILPNVGDRPIIQVPFGIKRTSDLTLWIRDWATIGAPSPHTAYDLFSLTKPRAYGSTVAAGRTLTMGATSQPVVSVLNVINGQPVIRYPDAADFNAYHQMGAGHNLGNMISASSFLVHAVFSLTAAANDGSPFYTNHGLVADGLSNWGIFIRKDTTSGLYKIMGYSNPGDYATNVESATNLTIGHPTCVSFRLTGGKVGIRVGTQATWEEVTCGNCSDLTGPFRIGTNSYTASPFAHGFNGDLADLIVRNAWSADRDAEDTAYIRARYGVA